MLTNREEFRHEIRNMIRDEIESYFRRNPDPFTRRLDSPDPIQNSGNYIVILFTLIPSSFLSHSVFPNALFEIYD